MLTCNVGLLSGVGKWDLISIRHPQIPRPWNPIRANPVIALLSRLSFRQPPCDNVFLTAIICYRRVGGTLSMVAPKGRKYLSADALLRLVRDGLTSILDERADEPGMSFTEALMSAFAMFSLTSPSLLAFDKERVEGNVQTISGLAHAPCDTYMRALIDPVAPEALRPVCQGVFRQL